MCTGACEFIFTYVSLLCLFVQRWELHLFFSFSSAPLFLQTTIADIQMQMTDNHEKNVKLREENADLAGKLKKFIEQHELREQVFADWLQPHFCKNSLYSYRIIPYCWPYSSREVIPSKIILEEANSFFAYSLLFFLCIVFCEFTQFVLHCAKQSLCLSTLEQRYNLTK